MAPTKQTELLVATKIAKVLGKATDLTWTVASLKFPIQNVGGNHLHGALRCRHLNILMTSSSRSNCKIVAVRWFFDTFWSIPMKKRLQLIRFLLLVPLQVELNSIRQFQEECWQDQKGIKLYGQRFFGPRSISFGPGHFSWTLQQFFWRWLPFFRTCAPSCWTCAPSCSTWPFPKPRPLWIDSPSCVLIAILQGARAALPCNMAGNISIHCVAQCLIPFSALFSTPTFHISSGLSQLRRGSTWCQPGWKCLTWGHSSGFNI